MEDNKKGFAMPNWVYKSGGCMNEYHLGVRSLNVPEHTYLVCCQTTNVNGGVDASVSH